MEFKNHHFETLNVLTESGKGHQRMLNHLPMVFQKQVFGKPNIHVFSKDNLTYHLLITKGKKLLYNQDLLVGICDSAHLVFTIGSTHHSFQECLS